MNWFLLLSEDTITQTLYNLQALKRILVFVGVSCILPLGTFHEMIENRSGIHDFACI